MLKVISYKASKNISLLEYFCVKVRVDLYIYIYIEREREREHMGHNIYCTVRVNHVVGTAELAEFPYYITRYK